MVGRLMIVALATAPVVFSSAAVAGDTSIRSLETAAKLAPDDGGAAVELANAYWRDGRTAAAFGAYRRALALDNVMLESPSGDPIWSHDVARRALAHQVMLTAR